MTLYHGSFLTIESPNVTVGRTRVDFGKGFYLTVYKEQAADWSRVVLRKHPRGVPTLNEYEFDGEKAKLMAGARYKVFEAYDLEWLDYVVDCRNGGTLQSQYDVVEGGVANDNVIDTIELYENGYITAEQAIGQLAYKRINHQIAILNQRIVDECLRFVSSEEVPNA